jgi:histidinol-phosphatase
VLHGDDLFGFRGAIGQDELYVDRITVPKGDGGLQPLEENAPRSSERVRSGLEFAKILHSKYLNLNLMSKYDKELAFGRDIARRAGELALRYREGGIGHEVKSDESPVTLADRECEKLIVSAINETFPEDGVLGEEGAVKDSGNRRKWIVDPIDGTRDFIRGTRAWSVLIGLEEGDDVVAGFAYFPATDEMYSASKGGGAFWNDERMSVSNITTRDQALICVNGFSFMRRYAFAGDLLEFLETFWTVRSMGGCLDSMLVSSGRADVWLEAQAKPWDLAPLKIIATEAGAVTFDFSGKDTIYGGNYVITVPALAEEVKRFVTLRSKL